MGQHNRGNDQKQMGKLDCASARDPSTKYWKGADIQRQLLSMYFRKLPTPKSSPKSTAATVTDK